MYAKIRINGDVLVKTGMHIDVYKRQSMETGMRSKNLKKLLIVL